MNKFGFPRLSTTIENFINDMQIMEELLDALPSTVFFIKDTKANYLFVNSTLCMRCGVKEKTAIIGKQSSQIFSMPLGDTYTKQDLEVLHKGKKLIKKLELHLYKRNEAGWCLTYKQPLYNLDGEIVGMAGISHDLGVPENTHPAFHKMLEVEEYIQNNFSYNITLSDLTKLSGISISQLERYFKIIYNLTPRQMICKVRLEMAVELLDSELSITEISQRCGYTDHSAFCRQFKNHTGFSPSLYRKHYIFEK